MVQITKFVYFTYQGSYEYIEVISKVELEGIKSMLETKCVDDNSKMLVTVLGILATNINYLLT